MVVTAKLWERLEKVGLQPAGASRAPASRSTSHGERGAGSGTGGKSCSAGGLLRNGDFGAFKVHLLALSMTPCHPTSSNARERGRAPAALPAPAHVSAGFSETGVKSVPEAARVLLVSEGRCRIVWAAPGNELNRTGKVVIWVWRHQTGWMSSPPDTQMGYPVSQPATQQRRLLNQSHTCK